MIKIKKKYSAAFILSATLLVSTSSAALDLGDLLSDTIKNVDINNSDFFSAIKSVVNASAGNILAGAKLPSDADGKVILYTMPACGYCKQALKHAKEKSIPFIEKSVADGKGENNKEARALGMSAGVPFIVFGKETMSGYESTLFDQKYAKFKESLPKSPQNTTENTSEKANSTNSDLSASIKSGDVLLTKIAGIKVYKEASKSAKKIAQLGKSTEVIYMGEESNGYYNVTTENGEGWVDKLLVTKK